MRKYLLLSLRFINQKQKIGSTQPMLNKKKSSFLKERWPLLVTFGSIGIVVLCYFLIPSFHDFIQETWAVLWSKDEEKISAYFKAFGFWGPLLITVLTAVQMFFIIFPNAILVVVSVLAYGPIWGTLLSILGNIVASLVGYYLGIAFGKQARRIVGEEKLKKVQGFLKEYGFGAVVIFRLCPFVSNDAISIVAGMSKMNFWRFMLATLVGCIPFNIAIAYFGRETETLKAGLYWVGGGGLVIYLIYVWLDHRKKRKKT